jgi:hypothetical protein
MDTNLTLSMNFDLSFAKGESDQYWTARSHMLGLVAYGATKRDSEDRLYLAIDSIVPILLNSGGVPVLHQWLDKHQVDHSITPPSPREHKTIRREVPLYV